MSLFKFSKQAANGGSGRLPANLRDQNQQSKVIIDSIDDGVVLMDDLGVIQLINPSAAKICGWKPEEATGISVYGVIKLVNEKGDPISDAENPLQQIFSAGSGLRANNAFLMNRSNQQIPISLNISPILDANRRVTAAVAVLNDVTQERAEERQRADFISTASHEMRTPVAAVGSE